MGPDPQTVLQLVTALLNLAVAVLVGAAVSRLWLTRGVSSWAAARRERVRKAAILAAVVAAVADLVALWLEAAAMAEVAITQAAGATWSMLTETHFGVAWAIGMAGLAVAAAGAFKRADRSSGFAMLTLVSLSVFWYARSMVSHAASEGDVSVRLLADWGHLSLMSLWVGEVVIAGVIMLTPSRSKTLADRQARAAYVASLSSSATIALAGIFVTGLYAAWRNVGGWANLAGNAYGNTLVIKVSLAGLAAALGGFNRFFVMQPWFARESAGDPSAERLAGRFRRVLWIETLVLVAVVVLAAWLASTSPPSEPV